MHIIGVDMSLERYRSKRDFSRTPEPAGDAPPSSGHRFVVQRHRATRLHFDFRLQVGGVLVSWAVPRGPTLDPTQRRMAIRTEDHPLDYFDFEGVIPAGQYGGGDVIVWDWGTFTPEETDDPAAALQAGELKFSLEGQKLRGRFTIVQTGRRRGPSTPSGDKDGWLLIKKRDAFAVAGWDAQDHPASVKSGRSNEEVAAGAPIAAPSRPPLADAAAALSAAPAQPMPEFIEPMKATLADVPFSDEAWLFEVKWDGYRVEAVVRDGQVRLWTRRHNDASRYFPDLAAAPDWIAANEAIVDGEVVALDERGNPSFSLLQDRSGIRGVAGAARAGATSQPAIRDVASAAAPLAYEVFDLLYLDGRSLLGLPLAERKQLLRSVLRPHPVVRYASDIAGEGEAFYEAARQRGLEGMVAKLRDSRYEPGRRSKSWLKFKLRSEQELVVAGWIPGKGSHRDLGSLVVGVYQNGELRHAGQVGSGIDAKTRRSLLQRLMELEQDAPPLKPAPRIKGARWVDPRLVIRAEFAEWTTDNLLRQAAFKGMELDRDPSTVTRERPVASLPAVRSAERATIAAERGESKRRQSVRATAAELAALDAMDRQGTWQIGGQELRLTNLDKVLWPGESITKRDLIRYYVSVAPTLLPYLAGRGVNLHRFPDGIGKGPGFWQKDVPSHAADWIARWEHTGHEGTKDYVVVDQVATLAWLAQEAAIEIHPWTSKTDAPQRPTYALIDIDPGEQTGWGDVLVLARLYRTALQHLGVIGVPKVTGQRGIQIWVPVKPIYAFDATRDWVERLSRAVAQTVPELVSWEWSKRARRGLVRLDYTQNAVNKTLVAPYSVRPAPGAPVSAPIAWDELDDPGLRPNGWSLLSTADRLAQVGDLFAAALALEQELPPL